MDSNVTDGLDEKDRNRISYMTSSEVDTHLSRLLDNCKLIGNRSLPQVSGQVSDDFFEEPTPVKTATP